MCAKTKRYVITLSARRNDGSRGRVRWLRLSAESFFARRRRLRDGNAFRRITTVWPRTTRRRMISIGSDPTPGYSLRGTSRPADDGDDVRRTRKSLNTRGPSSGGDRTSGLRRQAGRPLCSAPHASSRVVPAREKRRNRIPSPSRRRERSAFGPRASAR